MKITNFQAITRKVQAYLAGKLNLKDLDEWVSQRYHDPALVESNDRLIISGVHIRIREYYRLVGWSLEDFKQHLATYIANETETRKLKQEKP